MTAATDDGRDADGYGFAPAPRRHVGTYLEMLASSVLGLVASLVLAIDAVTLAADPSATFSCDISSTISCSTVALSWQAQLLGFPNAFLGLIFEPIVITVALASLGGTRFPRWFRIGVQALYTIAVFFAWWLFTQAYFVIGALCPWCLLITATTTLVFTSMTRTNILDGVFTFGRWTERVKFWVRAGADIWFAVLVIGIVAAMVVAKYL